MTNETTPSFEIQITCGSGINASGYFAEHVQQPRDDWEGIVKRKTIEGAIATVLTGCLTPYGYENVFPVIGVLDGGELRLPTQKEWNQAIVLASREPQAGSRESFPRTPPIETMTDADVDLQWAE